MRASWLCVVALASGCSLLFDDTPLVRGDGGSAGSTVDAGSEPDVEVECGADASFSTALVFVTSTLHAGAELGGVANADAICQKRADEACLPGTYLAWLSDGTTWPNQRFTSPPGGWQRVDGSSIADSLAQLTDGYLADSINVDEQGTEHAPDGLVWTGTNGTGTTWLGDGGQAHCASWSSSSAIGRAGRQGSTNGDWTSYELKPCDQALRLYCFGQ